MLMLIPPSDHLEVYLYLNNMLKSRPNLAMFYFRPWIKCITCAVYVLQRLSIPSIEQFCLTTTDRTVVDFDTFREYDVFLCLFCFIFLLTHWSYRSKSMKKYSWPRETGVAGQSCGQGSGFAKDCMFNPQRPQSTCSHSKVRDP